MEGSTRRAQERSLIRQQRAARPAFGGLYSCNILVASSWATFFPYIRHRSFHYSPPISYESRRTQEKKAATTANKTKQTKQNNKNKTNKTKTTKEKTKIQKNNKLTTK